jgi:hypothetical protein
MKTLYPILFLFLPITIVFSKEGEKDYTEAFKLAKVWLDTQKDFNKLPGLTAIIVKK